MLVLVGYVVVLGAVFGGYSLAGGHMGAMYQPLELLMIGGAALGAFVIGTPAKTIKATLKAVPTLLQGSKYTKAMYMQLMALLYEILDKTRKEGLLAIERDIEDPKKSALFKKYPKVLKDHHLVEFITDYLRLMVSGKLNAMEIEALMDREIDTHHHEAAGPAHAIQKIGDGLPAFGIVAAVMGVVHTMGSVGEAPAVLGKMIAGALVGTFLGILLSYGFVGPLADLLNAKGRAAAKPYHCVKAVLLASLSGYAPSIAAEFGRKVLFTSDRPTFQELDDAVRATKGAAKAQA